MGRFPTTFAGKPIYDRVPYVLYGELAFASAQINTPFEQATFSCQQTSPIEIHRMIPRLIALDSSSVPLATQPNQDLLASLIKLSVGMFQQVQKLTRVPTRIIALTKGESERTWEFGDPVIIPNATGFEVSAEAVAYPVIANLASILVCIAFEGFMLQMKAPDNT